MSLTISHNIMNNIKQSIPRVFVMADIRMYTLMLSITLWKDLGLPR